MITRKQLSFQDIYADCQKQFKNDKHKFLAMLDDCLDFDEIVPSTFRNNFYQFKGRPREYELYPMLKALLLQRIFTITTDTLLLTFLHFSAELREFCGFRSVPDAAKITRFKQGFVSDLQLMFDNLVDITEPICQKIDTHKASMVIFDTSGIEAWVRENNPKYADNLIKQLKTWAKIKGLDSDFDPHKVAYAKMPTHAAANPAIKQMYINGHFCYAYKFGMITNGLGIVRDITFYNKEFLEAHPEIVVEKKSDSPDEDKTLADSKALIPVLIDFLKKHPLINPKVFLGDSAFDSGMIYKSLLTELGFEKAYIPLKTPLLVIEDADCPINEHGVPCCPKDNNLQMKHEGYAPRKNGINRMKFVCPKMKHRKNPETGKQQRVTLCENPCTTSLAGRMFYVYPEKDFRAYPGVARNSDEFNVVYKIRGTVEQSIGYFKASYGLAGKKSRCEKTTHADLLLAGITQLITVVVADKIHQHQYIRSLKPLVA